jgi:pimeloyl-ACP methyl ester carboxylesterase
MAELSDALAAWMARIGLRRAVMIGNSMGCQVVVEFAVRYENRVDRLVLQGLTPDPAARTVFASRSGDSWSIVVMKDRGRSRASYCVITPPPARADCS